MAKSTVQFLLLIGALAFCVIISDAKNLAIVSNHPFDHVEISYAHEECSFKYSPVNFCDERHVSEIKKIIEKSVPNFNEHYILLRIKEWRPSEYYGDSVVAVDTRTGVAYPMPFDYYSGTTNMQNFKVIRQPNLIFSINSNRVCIEGGILVYRATTNGNFCFDFDGKKFSGYHTEYMN